MADNVELVRRLWSAFDEGGIDAVLEIADPDVEWEPFGGGGEVYRGHDGLRAYMQERTDRNEQTEARLYSAFARGDFVVGRGEVRIHGPHGLVTMQPGWLYEFRAGKLVRFRGFPTQEAALRAAGLAPQDPAAIVREMWEAFNGRHMDRMFDLFADDIEWRPYSGQREVYLGLDGARDWFDEAFGQMESVSASEYALREFGDVVAISGDLHMVAKSGGIVQRQVHYVFQVAGGKITSAQSFVRREEAIAAAQRAAGESPPG
jgi:ketosteroid isomerase-like protein